MAKAIMDNVKVEHIADEQPDLSYLETEWNDDVTEIISSCRMGNDDIKEHGLETVRRWAKEDLDRLEAYNNGLWGMVGIQAKATVKYPVGNGSYRLESFTSGGLWGIETDSDTEYIKAIEDEQLADLKQHLEMFNVDTSNFDKLAEDAHNDN